MIQSAKPLIPGVQGFYKNPTQRLFGNGSFTRLPQVLSAFNAEKVLLVLGQQSFKKSLHFQKLKSYLEPYEIIAEISVSQNPTQSEIQSEINRLRSIPFNLVLAIGGGSVLDVGKLLATVPFQIETDLSVYFHSPAFGDKSVPLVVLPTTSGTGSEVTPYVSLETSEKKKLTIGHSALYPTLTIIDPELTYSMPSYLTACTGFDALSQAIESYWSIHSTAFSTTHSLRALELIIKNLKKVIAYPRDADARLAMALGSCEAGLAIAQTKTTAVHSVSYPITAHFKIAHGHACALTLSSFIRFNGPVLKNQGMPLLKAFGTSTYDRMAVEIDELMDSAGLKRKLSSLQIDRAGIDIILRDGFRPDRINNNPRPVTREDLEKILISIQ